MWDSRMATPVYRRHTSLNEILVDGWSRGFQPEQTLMEASNNGYARCVVEAELKRVWDWWDADYLRYQKSFIPSVVVPL